jgi:hypothetical protein
MGPRTGDGVRKVSARGVAGLGSTSWVRKSSYGRGIISLHLGDLSIARKNT